MILLSEENWDKLPAVDKEEKMKLLQADQYYAGLNNRNVSPLYSSLCAFICCVKNIHISKAQTMQVPYTN